MIDNINIFLNNIESKMINLADEKKYYENKRKSIIHIVEVINNQNSKEIAREYTKIEDKIRNIIEDIDINLELIREQEEILENICDIVEIKEENEEKNEILLQRINEYEQKETKKQERKHNEKSKIILTELNNISEKILVNKNSFTKDNTKEDEIHIKEKKLELKDQSNDDNNVLVISEKDKSVYLPYTRKELNEYIKKGDFASEKDVIDTIYTVPLKKYSNFTVSRMKEAFTLMRKREKSSLKQAIEYAISMMFEKKLHPAIITSCRNRDELDIYLACLEDNVLSLFDFFEIKFEYNPVKITRNDMLLQEKV